MELIKPVFDSHGAELTILETTGPGNARDLVNHLDLAVYDGIIALGGDGTFHEVVNGLLKRSDGAMLPLGLIPGGSGNSLLHDLALVEPMAAVSAICRGEKRFIDAAEINMNDRVVYSINLIGWGLVTDVGSRSELLRWLGPSRYTVSSIIEIFRKKNRRAKLVIDDQTLVGEFSFVVACNSIHIGNGMKMAPHAQIDDGLIDLLVVDSDITRKRLFSVLPKLFDGTHVYEPEVKYHQVSRFSIISEEKDLLNVDGEMLGSTPINVKMLKQAIEIFA